MANTTRTWKDRFLPRKPHAEPQLHGFTQSALEERMFAAFKMGAEQRLDISHWARAASYGDDLQWSRILTQEVEDTHAAKDLADDFKPRTLQNRAGLDALLAFMEVYGRWQNLSAPIQLAAERISDRLQHQDHPAPWERSFPISYLPIRVEQPTATARRFSISQETTGRSQDLLLEAQSSVRMMELAQIQADLEYPPEDQVAASESIAPESGVTWNTATASPWADSTDEEKEAEYQSQLPYNHEDDHSDQYDDIGDLAGEHETQVQSKPKETTRSPKANGPANSATGPLVTPNHTTSANLNR